MQTKDVFGQTIFIAENMGLDHADQVLQFQKLESCTHEILTKAFTHSSGPKLFDRLEALIKENDKDKYDEVRGLFRPVKAGFKNPKKLADAVAALTGAIHNFNGTHLFIASLKQAESGDHPEWFADVESSIKKATAVKNRLIEANQGLIVQIIRNFIGACTASMTPIDLLQECNLGMYSAIEKFDWKRGNRFSTYATWWIKNSIRRALGDRGHAIRLPTHVYEKYIAIRNFKVGYYAKNGTWPTTAEIAVATEFTEEQIESVLKGRVFSNGQLVILSMEAPIKTEEDMDLLLEDTLSDQSAPELNELIVSHEIRGILEDFMETLTTRERTIIRLRFGFDKDYESDEDYHLADIGKVVGISRERVRQIQYDILKRMKESISHLSQFNPN